MISTTFSDLIAKYTAKQEEGKKKSWNWFLSESKKLREQVAKATPRGVTPSKALADPEFKKVQPGDTQGIIGKLFLFQYDPKGKKKLPYWDSYPVIFPINIYHNSVLGINLHYLPPVYRAQLMDQLYTLAVNKEKMDDTTRLRISYNILKNRGSMPFYKPCIKKYLFSNFRTQLAQIPVEQWDAVVMLPLQRFNKASETTVWAESVKKW